MKVFHGDAVTLSLVWARPAVRPLERALVELERQGFRNQEDVSFLQNPKQGRGDRVVMWLVSPQWGPAVFEYWLEDDSLAAELSWGAKWLSVSAESKTARSRSAREWQRGVELMVTLAERAAPSYAGYGIEIDPPFVARLSVMAAGEEYVPQVWWVSKALLDRPGKAGRALRETVASYPTTGLCASERTSSGMLIRRWHPLGQEVDDSDDAGRLVLGRALSRALLS